MSGVKDGLVWWWDLNSADATITDQHSGLVLTRHQTPTTVVGGAPDGGDCISFGAAQGKYRNASVPKTIAYERGFSANCWVFTTGSSTFGNRLINHRDLASPNQYFQFGVVHSTVGDFTDVFSASGSTRSVTTGLPGSSLNTWVMLTLVDNGSSTLLYRNGVLVGTSNTSLGTFGTTNAPFAIGGHAWQNINDSQLDHRGRMAMAGVWDRPLTADEITWLFNSGTGRRYNSLTFGERDLGGEVLWICPSLDDIGAGTLVARDLTTNRNHGILTNMDPPTDWVSDTANGGVRALDFDGVNDYVVSSRLPPTGQQAYSFWLRTNSANQSVAGFSDRLIPDGSGLFDRDFQVNASGFLQFRMFDTTGSINRFAISTTPVNTNNWFHCVAQLNGSTLQLYINGTLESTVTMNTPFNGYSTSFFLIGNEGLFRNYFEGRLDDIRLFSRALTQTEITALASQRGYQRPAVNGIGGEALWICPSLDTVGNGTLLARDLSNQRNHGTLTSMDVGDWVNDTANSGVRALDFDGVNDWVNVGNSSLLSFAPNRAFSISSWVWLRNLPGNSLFGITSRGQYNNNLEYNFYIGEFNNRVRFTLGDGITKAVYWGRSTGPISSTAWAHYCAVYDGSSSLSGMSIWINGVRADTENYTGGGSYSSMINQNANVSLGSLNFGNAFFLNGRKDDIRFFNRALTASEIAALASQRGYQLPSNTRRRRYAGAYGL